MLERSATLVADLCRKHKLPVTWLYAADLRAGKRGITTHKAVSDAFKRGSHWDPGVGFPVERYLALVRAKLGADAALLDAVKPLKDVPPLLRVGSEGWLVKRLQRLLRRHGFLPVEARIDGDFGEITEVTVKAFQGSFGLNPDGIVGPMTWRALEAADVLAPSAAHVLQPV